MPIAWLGVATFALMGLAAAFGRWLRRRGSGAGLGNENQETFTVSAVLGLMSLLMGFTLSLALDRFETRRSLVLVEANAIGTAMLRTQLLAEPHRSRINTILTEYLGSRLVYLEASPEERAALIRHDDELLVDMWAATKAAFEDIRDEPLSIGYLDSINTVIDLDSSRRTAAQARVPVAVLGLLLVFCLASSGVLGFVLIGRRRMITASFLLVLVALTFLLTVDIDGPSQGVVDEPQGPLLALRESTAAVPPDTYDKYLNIR